MNKKVLIGIATASLGLLALAGCTPSGTAPSAGSSSSSSQSATPNKTSSGQTKLATGDTSLGDIVVDGKGLTVYVFDKDTANSGKSTCEGSCSATWPAVTTTSDVAKATVVTGTVGTITRSDGTKQVTINGLPLYRYAADSAAGDVRGQGVGGIWWVVGPNGVKMTSAKGGY